MGDPPPSPLGFYAHRPGLADSPVGRDARPESIPAAKTTLGLRPRIALSFAWLQSVYEESKIAVPERSFTQIA